MASLEQGPQQLGQRFDSTVDRAVAPYIHRRDSGLQVFNFSPVTESMVSLRFLEDDITFARYYGRREADGTINIEALNRSITIDTVNRFMGKVVSDARFEMNLERGQLMRRTQIGGQIMGPVVFRALGEEESDALISYVTSPHMNFTHRETALRLTPDEEAEIQHTVEAQIQSNAELRDDLRALSDMQRQSSAGVMHLPQLQM